MRWKSDAHLTSPQWKHRRRQVLERDGWQCQIRGQGCTQYATQVDHIVDRADGGSLLDLTNLRASCKTCNARKSADRTNSRARSLPFRL